ncbi:hypothetical protein [Streptodolium elevatio]|uniref:Uncharacterized protein n=1 Tax=Streptodolium elevatio TaxID=3157996 RepID=A0ABV3DR15_9ACTN
MNEYARGIPESPAEWGLLAVGLAVFGGAFLVRALWRRRNGRPVSTREDEDPNRPDGPSRSAWKWWLGAGAAGYVGTVIVRAATGADAVGIWLFPALVFPACGLVLPARTALNAWSARKGHEFRAGRRHDGSANTAR